MRKLLLACVAAIGGVAGVASVGSALAQSATQSAAPGSVTVRLNGRVNWYAGVEGSSVDSQPDGTKTSTTDFLGYLRLYPGFDGIAANGLHYGAAAEIRMNGAKNGTTEGANNETLFVFQAYGYLGLPHLGQVSFGQENGPTVIFETGTFEGFNDGGWNGDIEGLIPGAANPVYPFPDSGSGLSQATNKIVYLSPDIAGFQFGVGFEPNHVAENQGPVITSSPNPIVGGMPRNLIDVGGQYTKTIGPVGIQAGIDYLSAGQVNNTGGPQPFTTPTSYHNLNILSGGLTLSYAGLTVGGNSVYGAFNQVDGDTFQLEPAGGKNAAGWLAGAQYTMGPAVFGASFFRFTTTGDLPGGVDAGSTATISAAGLTSGQQQNTGVAAGGTYTLVPGVNLFVDYLYGWRKQSGFDFATGNAGTDSNYVQSQLVGVGTQIQW
jgi:Gram-negative porin